MTQITGNELEEGRPEIARAEVVCLVDDDPSVRKSVSRLLESDGFSVCAFSEPEAFLNHLTTNSVPVAVLDIWMESMTGMELLAHLCAKSPQTRVIFITGHEDRAAEATVMSAGAFAFFIKPFDDDQFLSAVHRALGHSIPEKKESRQRIHLRSRFENEMRR
jgi:FixJ family two-component response regulator